MLLTLVSPAWINIPCSKAWKLSDAWVSWGLRMLQLEVPKDLEGILLLTVGPVVVQYWAGRFAHGSSLIATVKGHGIQPCHSTGEDSEEPRSRVREASQLRSDKVGSRTNTGLFGASSAQVQRQMRNTVWLLKDDH